MQYAAAGIYSVCVGNLASRLSAKLVDFFLSTYTVHSLRQRSDDRQHWDEQLNNVTVRVYSLYLIHTAALCAGAENARLDQIAGLENAGQETVVLL